MHVQKFKVRGVTKGHVWTLRSLQQQYKLCEPGAKLHAKIKHQCAIFEHNTVDIYESRIRLSSVIDPVNYWPETEI